MMCGRCGGLMIIEPLYPVKGLTLFPEPQEVRCLNCGNVEDAVIAANRVKAQSATRITGPRHWVRGRRRVVNSAHRKTLKA